MQSDWKTMKRKVVKDTEPNSKGTEEGKGIQEEKGMTEKGYTEQNKKKRKHK